MQRIYNIRWTHTTTQDLDCSVQAENRKEAWRKFHADDFFSPIELSSETDVSDPEIVSVENYYDDEYPHPVYEPDHEHPDCGPE